MIQQEDIDAMAIYNDSTGYWTGDDNNHYATPLDMVKYFKDSKHTSTENFAWYFWPKGSTGDMRTLFYGQ